MMKNLNLKKKILCSLILVIAVAILVISVQNIIEKRRALQTTIEINIERLGSNYEKKDRLKAIKILGEIGSKRAVPALLETLRDWDYEIRKATIESLGEIGDARAVPDLLRIIINIEETMLVITPAKEALKKIIDREGLSLLVDMIRHKNVMVCSGAISALREIGGERALPILVKLLKDNNYATRCTAAEALGEMGDSRAVEPLIATLKDKDSDVRYEAAEALAKIGKPAIEPLIAALKDKNWRVQYEAAQALGKIGDPRAVEPLISALKDKNANVQIKATEALGKIRDKRAIEPLIAALKDEDSGVRCSAAEALDKLGWKARNESEEVLYLIAKQDWDGCVEIGKPTVESLISALKDKDSDVRWRAAEALGKIGDSRAVEPLITALKDKEWNVRIKSAEALGKIGDRRAIESLIAALADEYSHVGEKAAEALAKIGKPAVEPLTVALRDKKIDWEARIKVAEALAKIGRPAVEPLIAALKDGNSDVRCRAAEALGKIGDSRAVEPLITALKDENHEVRWRVAQALGRIGDSPAVESLIAALKKEHGSVRWRAAEALGKIGDSRAVEPLIAALKDEYNAVRKAAAEALGEIGDSRAVEPLTVILKDEDVPARIKAAKALGKIGDKRAIPALIEALKDKDKEVRKATAEALGEIGDKRAIPALSEALKDEKLYVQKVIIDAKWGEGLGEFGLMEEEGRWGPESLAIDNQGNIYILDSINERIQKFNKKGKYTMSITLEPHIRFRHPDELCIDQVSNLYVLKKGFPGGVVRQYTQKGELVREYPISNLISQVWNINVDESGNLFVEGEGYVRTEKEVYQLGTKDKAYDPTQQLKSVKRGIPCKDGEYRYEIGKRKVGKRKYLSLVKILDRKGKLKKEIVVKKPAFWSIPTTFLGVDQAGHIYIKVQVFIGKKEDLGFEVHKYDKRGNLLAKIEMPHAYITCRASYRPIAIDKFGNVYQLQLLETGVRVVKWEKIKSKEK